jgi:hypothetical protein
VTIPDSAVNLGGVRWLQSRRHVTTIVRAQSAGDVPSLLAAGAKAALVPEAEGARAFGHAVLGALRKDDAMLEPQE